MYRYLFRSNQECDITHFRYWQYELQAVAEIRRTVDFHHLGLDLTRSRKISLNVTWRPRSSITTMRWHWIYIPGLSRIIPGRGICSTKIMIILEVLNKIVADDLLFFRKKKTCHFMNRFRLNCQVLISAAFYLGLHCLPMPIFWDARLKWVKVWTL